MGPKIFTRRRRLTSWTLEDYGVSGGFEIIWNLDSRLLVVDGPMNGSVFLAYVEQQLLANTNLKPGDSVIMDNLSSHKRAGAKYAIESAAAEPMYLPP